MTAPATDVTAALDSAVQSIAARAAAIDDASADLRDDLAALGGAGLLRLGLDSGDLPDMVRVIVDVSAVSLAVGFSTWAHRLALHYLHLAPNPLRDNEFDAIASGGRFGVTAMAAGLRYVSGFGDLPVVARRDGDGLRISGPIRWASNVFPGALIVAPARTERGDTFVVAIDADADGATVNPPPKLMALNATASTSLHLDDVAVPADRVVSSDLHGFVAQIRPTFLLLQTAFCVGVGGAALGAAAERHRGNGAQFTDELAALDRASNEHTDKLYRWAAEPGSASPADQGARRQHAARLAVDATPREVTLTGGAGYAWGHPANRRFREAAFLPIQSPSEGQLRWELTRCE